MLSRLARSVKQRGLLATMSVALSVARTRLTPRHARAHLRVPLYLMRSPRHARLWLADRLRPATPIEQRLPFLPWPLIESLSAFLRPDHRVFEWGGGGSTLFFLSKGCEVTTVESSRDWVQRIESMVEPGLRENLSMRFVEMDSNGHPGAADYIAAVASGGPWDVILVDGWRRLECLEKAHGFLSATGVIILDNADQPQFADVPSCFAGWNRLAFTGLGPGRSWVTRSDVYFPHGSRGFAQEQPLPTAGIPQEQPSLAG